MHDLFAYLEYLEYQKHYSKYTIDNYERDIEEFLAYLSKENVNYLNLEYSDIRFFLTYLKEEKKKNLLLLVEKLVLLEVIISIYAVLIKLVQIYLI